MSKETGFSRIVIIVSICVVAVLISGVAVAVSWNSTNKKTNQTTQVVEKKVVSPEEAANNHMMNVETREWGQGYNDLLPKQQETISKATYIKCGSKDNSTNVKVDVLGSHHEIDHQVPAYGDLDSIAVDLKVDLQNGPYTMSLKRTVHVYNINGTWKSSVSQGTFDAQSKGQCN